METPPPLNAAQRAVLDSMGILWIHEAGELLFARDLEGALWLVADNFVGPVTQELHDILSGDATLADWWALLTAG